jgi:hypothetical protein
MIHGKNTVEAISDPSVDEHDATSHLRRPTLSRPGKVTGHSSGGGFAGLVMARKNSTYGGPMYI